MKAVIFATALTISSAPDVNWHYVQTIDSKNPVEIMRVAPDKTVLLRSCNGRLHRIGHFVGKFVPANSRKIEAGRIAFDTGADYAERALANRIIADVRAQKSSGPWGMECIA